MIARGAGPALARRHRPRRRLGRRPARAARVRRPRAAPPGRAGAAPSSTSTTRPACVDFAAVLARLDALDYRGTLSSSTSTCPSTAGRSTIRERGRSTWLRGCAADRGTVRRKLRLVGDTARGSGGPAGPWTRGTRERHRDAGVRFGEVDPETSARPQQFHDDDARDGHRRRVADMMLITRHEDVMWALRNPEVFSSNMDAIDIGNVRPLIPLQIDPPEHVKFRRLLDPLFAPREVEKLEAAVRSARQRADRRVRRHRARASSTRTSRSRCRARCSCA